MIPTVCTGAVLAAINNRSSNINFTKIENDKIKLDNQVEKFLQKKVILPNLRNSNYIWKN